MNTEAGAYMELRDKVLNQGVKLTADEISLVYQLRESYDDYVLSLEANELMADENWSSSLPEELRRTTIEWEKEKLFQDALKTQEEELGILRR